VVIYDNVQIVDSANFSGYNTEAFTAPTGAEVSGNKLTFAPDMLPEGHSGRANQSWTVNLTNISSGQANKSFTVNASDVDASGLVTIELNGYLNNVDATFNFSVTPNAVSGVKDAGSAASGTGVMTGIVKPTEKISLFDLAETKYNSLVGIKNLTQAEIELIDKLGGVEIDGKLINTDEIKSVEFVKVYGDNASDNLKNLSKTFSCTIIANVTLQQTAYGTEKTGIARIHLTYSNPKGITADTSNWGDDLCLTNLIKDGTINDVELAVKAETFELMELWKTSAAFLGQQRKLSGDAYTNPVNASTFMDDILFMSDIDWTKPGFDNNRIIYSKLLYNATQDRERIYDRTLSGNFDYLTDAWGLDVIDSNLLSTIIAATYNTSINGYDRAPLNEIASQSGSKDYTNSPGTFYTATFKEYQDAVDSLLGVNTGI
jgi:hypothetical protein